jgi:PAS domain S-box-containing protein
MSGQDDLRERLSGLERELADARASLRTLVESLPFDFWMMDAEGRYIVQNEVARRRWCDAVGRRLEDLPVDERMRRLWLDNNQRAFAGETVREEVSYPLDGEMRHFLNIIAPIVEDDSIRGILGVNIDVTDRKRFDEQSQRVQRVESLGVLAAGLAHDFNNQLMAILASVDMARRPLPSDHPSAEQLVDAEHTCREASALTQQFLTFARGGENPRTVVDLGPLVRDAATMATRGSSSRCEVHVEHALWTEVDASQIRQVVHNLVLNAVQAMPSAGVVRVTACNVDLGRTPPPGTPAGRSVRIEVADEGPGIKEADLARVFDPYFTTKERGRGLGLAVVQSVLHKHGGAVSVRSLTGKGTTFEVLVPAVDPPPVEIAEPTANRRAISGRLLVVDDEPRLQRALARMLRAEGMDVEAVGSASEASAAVRRARTARRPFGLVLMDMTLHGGRSGVECLEDLRAVEPAIAAVAMSGYTDTPAVLEPESQGFGASLTKPFTREELLAALARASASRG